MYEDKVVVEVHAGYGGGFGVGCGGIKAEDEDMLGKQSCSGSRMKRLEEIRMVLQLSMSSNLGLIKDVDVCKEVHLGVSEKS
ncbi:hypothetical protein C5167_034238 [Papaver somniferum]|uniref:Uncharacterized protein n=1 Tax=Papaver somniferum TaxID=3469 RepID=A0A4Y7KCB3_PAPSO|nr:hypothetical protein C5167_034238 [Papaver somniferum]